MLTYHIIVSGKVQGVFYRVNARDKAKVLNLVGWVKNSGDGNVEILATGNEEDLEQFISWCKVGPPKAFVEEVTAKKVRVQLFDAFSVLR